MRWRRSRWLSSGSADINPETTALSTPVADVPKTKADLEVAEVEGPKVNVDFEEVKLIKWYGTTDKAHVYIALSSNVPKAEEAKENTGLVVSELRVCYCFKQGYRVG